MNKELLWFNPRLVKLPVNTVPELSWHLAWYNLTGMNVCLTDTSGISHQYGNGLRIKNIADDILNINPNRNLENGKYWHNNFSELVNRISNDIFDKAEGIDEICVSYSGGTDSCLVLAALWSNPRIKNWIDRNKFVIHTTPHAKKEDPAIWNRILEANLPLKFLDYDALSIDQSEKLMVDGEGNGYPVWFKVMSREFTDHELFNTNISQVKDKAEKWFIKGDPSGVTWEFFNKLISTSPSDIETLVQAWALFENTCAQQCYMLRVSAYGIGPVQITPRNNWRWFMADSDFWDVCAYEQHNRIYTTDDTLKYQVLKYVSDWMGWTEVKTKKKISSQILVPKLLRKSQIFSDLSHTGGTQLWR